MKKIMDIAYTFLGNIFAAFAKWLILILIVRITNPEMVGYYTFAIALTSPIMLFANMRLRLRYVVEDDLDFKSLKIIRILLDIACLTIVLIVTVTILPNYIYITLLISLTKILDLSSELYYGILQKEERFKEISLMMIGKNILLILVFAIIIFTTKDIYLSIIGQVIAQLAWLLLIERKPEREIRLNATKIKLNVLSYIFVSGLSLGFVQLINSYNILIPRYVIERFVSLKAVGIFASISYLLTIMDLFMNALSQNFITTIKRDIDNGQLGNLRSFINIKVIIIAIFMGTITICATFFLGKPIIEIIYGKEYAANSIILIIISLSIMFNFLSWMYDSALMALKVYKSQMIVSVCTLIGSIAISLILIPKFGLVGAAISVVAITIIQAGIKFLLINLKLSSMGV